MNHRGFRAATFAVAALVLAMASAACGSSEQPTPIYVVVTPTPGPATQAPATPTAEATPLATFTPWPTATPTPEPTPTPTLGPTETPSSGPTSPAGFCTGTAGNQAFFLEAAKGVKSAVYCATGLPSGWAISSGNWAGTKSGGWVTVAYKYKKTSSTMSVSEGAFCLTPTVCSPPGGSTSASFGGLAGALFTITGGYGIYVAPGTAHAYQIVGANVTQTTLVNAAAAMKIVPKS